MKFEYDITFYWEGKTQKISVVPENTPLSKDAAETVAWTAIRGWFEARQINIPEFVRNVQLDDIKGYHWDILPLGSSTDRCK